MTKNKKGLLITGIILLVILLAALAVLVVLGLDFLKGDPDETTKPKSEDLTYTVRVMNATDVPLEGVGVYVYEDETQAELVWFDKTNADGAMFFNAPESDEYIAVLGNIPTGYTAEAQYPITGEVTQIILAAGVLSDEDMQTVTYKLGDVMMDFTIIDTEGNEYTLSELLKTKKAVVLNFWYLTCQPCRNEFPHMQEAYEKYKNDIEILAMNPVDADEAAVAAFKKELGLTFPMAVVDELWAQMLQLTAYPTTVVIDRFGNISLIHKGSIDSADTFEQLFEYFAADDYEQRAILSIEEIVTEEEGTEDNPMMQGGDQNFNITVGGGETYYLELYKITGKVYLTVKGEDFSLTYNGKTYDSKNGSVTITITSEGPSTPVKLSVKNKTTEEQTYNITLAAPKGTLANPHRLALGEFSMNTESGNEQGVYGVYTAEKNGTLTVRCLSSSVKKYGFFLYNLRSYAMRNADEDGKVDEDGYVTVAVQVKKGDQVQFNVAVARDSSNYIAAGSFKFELILTDGDGEEEKKAEAPKTTYTVLVTDLEDKPISGVTVNVKGEFTYEPTEEDPEDLEPQEVSVDVNLTTGEDGKVVTEQVTGPYTATIRIPEDYTLVLTQYELTPEAPSVTVKLTPVVKKDYTVKVVYEDNTPAENVIVMVGSAFGYTDAQGAVTFNLPEDTYTASLSQLPEGYEIPENVALTFPAGETTLTVTLSRMGTQSNPYEVKEFPFITEMLDGGKTIYANFYYESDPVLTIEDADAVVVYNGTTYTADTETGILEVPLAESTLDVPVTLEIKNGGASAENYIVKLVYPLGSKWNPEPVENLAMIVATLTEGDEDGHYYQYTNGGGGTFDLSVFMANPATIKYKVTVSSETTGEVTLEDTASVYVKYGESAIIFVQAVPVETEVEGSEEPVITIPAVTVYMQGEFEVDPNAKPEDTEADIVVPEGKTLYTVVLKDFEGNPVPDIMVRFLQNDVQKGADMTAASGKAYAALDEGNYTVALASSGSDRYYYEEKTAAFASGATTLELQVTKVLPGTAEEHWSLGVVQPVKVGGTYCDIQSEVVSFYTFRPDTQGVYRFTTSDPDAIISYWGADNYPAEQTDTTDYADNAFTRSVNTNALGQNLVIGITGAEDCILIITRVGDAVEDVPDEVYVAKTTPEAFTFTMPAGKSFTFVDLTGETADYQAVYNETDGYYHLGTADGPILYVQLADNTLDPDNPIAPPYVPLYRMVGGMGDNTGTALRGTYTDAEGNEIRLDYTECMLAYGACADATYGVYPLTEDLIYMLQNGGEYQGWWDPANTKGNLLFMTDDEEPVLDTNINLELGWMFAVCYIDG